MAGQMPGAVAGHPRVNASVNIETINAGKEDLAVKEPDGGGTD